MYKKTLVGIIVLFLAVVVGLSWYQAEKTVVNLSTEPVPPLAVSPDPSTPLVPEEPMEKQVPATKPLDITTYELGDATFDVISAFELTADPTIRVLHLCDAGDAKIGENSVKYCPTENTLLAEVGGVAHFVDIGDRTDPEAPTPILQDARLVQGISARVFARKLLIDYRIPCPPSESLGACLENVKRFFVVDLSSKNVVTQEVDYPEVLLLENLSELMFNPTLTRVVNQVGCPEGCPEEVVGGYDLETGKTYTFPEVKRTDENGDHYFLWHESSWADDDTFRAVISDEGDKTHEVLLKFE